MLHLVLGAAAFAANHATVGAFPLSSQQSLNGALRGQSASRRQPCRPQRTRQQRPLFSDYDPDQWTGGDDPPSSSGGVGWDEPPATDEWSAFASPSSDDEEEAAPPRVAASSANDADVDGGEEAWLDALAGIAADEVAFMSTEAERADQARRMQELNFSSASIASTLGVAVDGALEFDASNEVLEAFKGENFGMMVDDDVDLETVESHSTAQWDEELDEPVRAQHVYVDEVTCIGCTNCASIAQSTFFMEGEHGRARVFQQWGDDDETIAIAIETCPVDCIHYVPYDELKRLEVERRDQNINFKARLVSQAEYQSGAGVQSSYGGERAFTGQQVISGNMGARCNNCPSRGCKNCPMFGVGLNPEYAKREERRKKKKAEREMKKRMESQNKRAEL